MTWSFEDYRNRRRSPANNADTILRVEPNADGKWHLRFEGDPIEDAIGSFATAEIAERAARENCTHVKVVMPPKAPTGTPAYIPNMSPDDHLLSHFTKL
ncbi:MAG: hypothetical protein WC378_05310 [Opitutaceae bacterium]|jgi:hypothetical protein